jgi:endonuclease/exonuclease/phosphatase family metal-dependent hydrolase
MILRTFVGCLLLLTAMTTAEAQSLPPGWTTSDIGAVGATGSATGSGSSFSVMGAGADVWGGVDAFRFAYTQLTGDGSIVTRVSSIDAVNVWTKGGVMMRDSLAANSRHAFMLVSPGKGLAFQRRVTAGGDSTHTGVSGTAPAWLRLTRSGSLFTAYRSTDGSNWTRVDSDTIAMGSTIYVGVAVSSHVTGVLAAASFASTIVTAASTISTASTTTATLPTGWNATDIGAVGAAGSSSGSDANLIAAGAGADVWGAVDALRFTYTQLTGDGSIVGYVSTLDNVNAWTKAGVMMRETLAANSRHAFMLVSPGKGLAFQRRVATGGESTHTSGGTGVAPAWVKLTRAGTTFSAFRSADGVNWTQVGSDTIAMGSTIYVGLGVSSHVAGVLATASFTSVAVTAAPIATPPPSISSSTLRLLQWNTHHGGIGTDGVYNPGRIADWIKTMNPDVVSLNEVSNADQAAGLAALTTSKTGVTWRYYYDDRGNMMMTKLAIASESICLVNSSVGRKATQVGVLVNGRAINVWSAHLDESSSTARLSETQVLQGCEQSWTEARIAAGDFNMQTGSAEYNSMATGHTDAWLVAKSLGTAVNYSGNCDGCTRNSRIDYVFTSKGATLLTLKSAQIFDTRDANGYMPSDHKPLLVTYQVN